MIHLLELMLPLRAQGGAMIAALLLAAALLCPAAGWGDEEGGRQGMYLELSAPDRWTLVSQGDYHGRYDARDLYCMYHLCSTAAAGDHATLTTAAAIPEDWRPPYGLELFCSDDYQVRDDQKPAEGWMACHAYPGRRFKQILVDGEVVWEQDVADAGVGGAMAVDLTPHVRPGRAFELALRVLDRVATDAPAAGDHFWPGNFEPREDPRLFPTHVYWGDLLLTERFDAEKLRPLRETPAVRALRERAARGGAPRGPMKVASRPGELVVEAPVGAPAGWPLSCGVPLPEGAVRDAAQLRLTDADGRDLNAQREAISWWRDGSVRWALVSLPVPEGMRDGDPLTLTWDQEPAPAPEPRVRLERDGAGWQLSNDVITLHLPGAGEAAWSEITGSRGQRIAGALTGHLELEAEDGSAVKYGARWNSLEILSEGPRRVEVQLRGELTGDAGRLGRCTLRLALMDGSPLVRGWLRVFNDTEQHLKVTWMALDQRFDGGVPDGVDPVLDDPVGWFALHEDAGSLFAAVRWAAETPTKELDTWGRGMTLSFFTGSDAIPYYRPRAGEARRTEFMLGFFDQEPEGEVLHAIAQAVQRPPRLWSARWACATGALGYGSIHDEQEFARLTDNRRRLYGDLTRERVGAAHYDMRDFGDRRYGEDRWCNNYYDGIRGYLAEYLMTGNPNAFDRAAEAVAHTIDVDQCHWWPDPQYVGGVWAYVGSDHSNGGYHWAAQQRTAAGLAYYYRLTGDPDAREALRMMGDWAATHNTGYGSVRDHGGILTAQVWAYDELGDERYLRGALETMADLHARMSRRRGPYLEPNGNWSFIVSIPWMAAELADAHYRLWQLTGNVEAAATALGLADSLIEENGTWGLPGEMGGYSGYPHFKINSNYHVILAPVLGYGYEMTGDPRFLLWMRACYERMLDEDRVDAIQNNYWLAPALLYLLHHYRDVEIPMPPPPAVRVPPNCE